MAPRLLLGVMVVLAAAVSAAARPSAAQSVDLARHVGNLSAFDYATRTLAARALRRAPAAEVVPALVAAARGHADQFVRYRALVLLTSFDTSETSDVMKSLLADRNDRVREVVYRWFEWNPDPSLRSTLVAALETEQADFVRPALVRAVAALPPDDPIQRMLIGEVSRGLDFFRSAAIEALGERRAAYAVEAIASVAALDGPLQDDAVLALGRIGGPVAQRALNALGRSLGQDPDPPPAAALMLHAAACLLGVDDCGVQRAVLSAVVADPKTPIDDVRLAADALVALAEDGDSVARDELYRKVVVRDRDAAARALAKWALRHPVQALDWLLQFGAAKTAIELLHDGFEILEEDLAEEQFFAAARAAYWKADERSTARTVVATLVDTLEF